MRRHEGFTLLEMLVIIVIMGILSTAMYLSMINISVSADAKNIINNMIMLKHVALIWYKENLSRITYDSKVGCKITTNGKEQNFDEFVRDHSAEFLKYLDNKSSLNIRSKLLPNDNKTGDYSLITMNNYKQWYVCYNTGTTDYIIRDHGNESPELEVKKRIAGKAEKLGLLGKAQIGDTNFKGKYTDQKIVCMLILDLN